MNLPEARTAPATAQRGTCFEVLCRRNVTGAVATAAEQNSQHQVLVTEAEAHLETADAFGDCSLSLAVWGPGASAA